MQVILTGGKLRLPDILQGMQLDSIDNIGKREVRKCKHYSISLCERSLNSMAIQESSN